VGRVYFLILLVSVLASCAFCSDTNLLSIQEMKVAYPTFDKLKKSPGKVRYYIDPVNGSDQNSGRSKNLAWKGFTNINRMLLAPGDQVLIIKPGSFNETLNIRGSGTKKLPISIIFAPGRYDLFPNHQLRKAFHISNANDEPYALKSMGIYIQNAKNIRIIGKGTHFYMRGKMIEVCIDHSENIQISGITLDYHRPTVSEYKVLAVTDKFVKIRVHKDSTYELRNGKLVWLGEGWESRNWTLIQKLDVKNNVLRRTRALLPEINNNVEEVSPFVLKFPLPTDEPPHFTVGDIYQVRETRRDCAGIFQERSKNIVWKNCEFNFLHGMGVVSQFSSDLRFDHIRMAPKKGSGRTCAAWADILHFSGCRGKLEVLNVYFSGANDDAINVHGTHLRIIERISDYKIKVRYCHGQSYGFEQYIPGDIVDFIRTEYMTPYASNKVKQVEKEGDKVVILTFSSPVPDDIKLNLDVIENATWTADLHVNNCVVDRIPTRGFLVTTRGKVLIENTIFYRPEVGILCEDDARGWFESGFIRDMTIKDCTFLYCSIVFSPKASGYSGEGVHQNINLIDNKFYMNDGAMVNAHHVDHLNVIGNTVYTNNQPLTNRKVDSMIRVDSKNCKDLKVGKNKVIFSESFINDYDTMIKLVQP
jgi:hypothetical protein